MSHFFRRGLVRLRQSQSHEQRQISVIEAFDQYHHLVDRVIERLKKRRSIDDCVARELRSLGKLTLIGAIAHFQNRHTAHSLRFLSYLKLRSVMTEYLKAQSEDSTDIIFSSSETKPRPVTVLLTLSALGNNAAEASYQSQSPDRAEQEENLGSDQEVFQMLENLSAAERAYLRQRYYSKSYKARSPLKGCSRLHRSVLAELRRHVLISSSYSAMHGRWG